jgi:multidrug efflux pump subunit AcrA (membrane-fusion protein)
MNSPYRVHPALPIAERDNTIPFRPPSPPKPQGPSKLELLVSLEGAIRKLPKRSALALHAVNETRALTGHEQAFMFRLNRNGKPVLDMASSVSRVDMHAPLTRAITHAAASLPELDKAQAVDLRNILHPDDYPFSFGYWSPLLDRKGKCFGGLLFFKAQPFVEAEGMIASRLGLTYAHAIAALSPPSMLRMFSLPKWMIYAVPPISLALIFIPVPLTALAPFEVVAKNPSLVTAPIDGAIADVVAEPNQQVRKGDLLFRFDTTVLKAESEIAQQRSVVAEAKLATATNGAFTDMDAKRSLAELQTEVDLAHAERDYALQLLKRTDVHAAASGVLVYAAKSDWLGKPVRVGEKIMEIANPQSTEYLLDLGVHDSISLDSKSRVKLFLDADPMHPHEGVITEMSYHATEKPGGLLAYTLRVDPSGAPSNNRIGLRGTAQIAGEKVSLGFYLLRRPIAALRQYFGI